MDQKVFFFGNITFCWFTQEPNEIFYHKISELHEEELGEMKVEKISLITANSVSLPSKTHIIEDYYSKNPEYKHYF